MSLGGLALIFFEFFEKVPLRETKAFPGEADFMRGDSGFFAFDLYQVSAC